MLEELDVDRHGDVEAAIVAYPHGAAAPVVAALRERGVRVVDLSADFRLQDRRPTSAGTASTARPSLFGTGVYGLPEVYGSEIALADLVANPGCYPTATLLALAPLARSGTMHDVVVDAKSGRLGRWAGAEREDALRRRRRERRALRRRRATATCPRSTRSSPRSARP